MSQSNGKVRDLEMTRLRAELRNRRLNGWSSERLRQWVEVQSNDGYTDDEIEYARNLLRNHSAYK